MSDDVPAPDSVEQFAADLRLLRVRAGSPTLASLQHATGISRTVLSDAFAGKQLPSARTVDGIVTACKTDPVEWLRRRDQLAKRAAVPEGEEPPAVVRKSRHVHWVVAAVIGLAGFALGAGTSNVVTTDVMQAQVTTLKKELAAAGPVNPHAQIQVRTGVDPAMTPCVNDAKVSASEDRPHNTRIQIIWSNKCYAGWARIARYDGLENGNEVTVSIYPETAPKGPDRQDATEPGVQGAYTTLIVRPSPQTRLCAVGSITVGSQTISLGDPICT
ncbi:MULTISPECIES: DUF2690 domain-containing protein [unclassified Leifsonia]|uniref:DUF2690 domain-containing protein n=1 Tax=unclassified Leifsonia TaxID=2663824 RepID=UPI0008A7ECED|nr:MULTISPECIES: DUF2690 domain-containing protein [unclassified Leifsonia]SEI09978.1 Protein of unknown function [Leifsonia sp. CL154]SFL86965.1 Protein of unknown function [Leifsonia sp. CL147]